MTALCLSLVFSNLVQAFFWAREVQKLVDKLMSRNYHEYSQSKSPSQMTKASQKDFEKVDTEDLEDFRTLSGIGL